MTTLAPKLPWQHAYAGGFPRLGGQALPTDADAIDYLNRVKAADGGVGVEVGVAQAIDAFVKGCKADSAGYAGDPTRTNWDALKTCCIMAGARTISGALVPLKGTAPTAQGGWTSNEYSRGGTTPGLKGNGSTLYLDTNRAGNADGQDDVHLCTYVSTALSVPVFDAYIGASDQSTRVGETQIGRANTVGNFFAARGEPGRQVILSPFPTGVLGVSRASGSEIASRVEGASTVTSSISETSPPRNYFVFARNNNGAADGFSPARLSFYSIGSAIDLAALDARVSTLMAAIQAFLP